jgi:hypothetical protein
VQDNEFEGVRSRLEAIAEELADMGLAKLREAIGTGAPGPAADERLIGRARRSVLKAVSLLSGISDDDET